MTQRDRIRTKLQRVRMSGRMAALLGCVFQERWTEPRIVELCVTSDGCLLARREGDIGFNDFIGSVDDWRRNVLGIAKMAGLTAAELRTLRQIANV